MAEATYTYKINSVRMKSGESFTPGRINVFVGANNCGKTRVCHLVKNKRIKKSRKYSFRAVFFTVLRYNYI